MATSVALSAVIALGRLLSCAHRETLDGPSARRGGLLWLGGVCTGCGKTGDRRWFCGCRSGCRSVGGVSGLRSARNPDLLGTGRSLGFKPIGSGPAFCFCLLRGGRACLSRRGVLCERTFPKQSTRVRRPRPALQHYASTSRCFSGQNLFPRLTTSNCLRHPKKCAPRGRRKSRRSGFLALTPTIQASVLKALEEP